MLILLIILATLNVSALIAMGVNAGYISQSSVVMGLWSGGSTVFYYIAKTDVSGWVALLANMLAGGVMVAAFVASSRKTPPRKL